MEIHRPKPIGDWRDFIKEVGIIVLGVLIALGAEEALSDFHWRQEVEIVQDSLDDELSDSLFNALERVKITECQRRTLDRLDQIADESNGTLVLRNEPVTRNRVWGTSAWDAAVASGAIAHMDHDTRNIYAELFSFVRLFRDFNIRQEELWARIDAYRRPRALTADSRDRFVETVSELRALTSTMNRGAQQFVQTAEPLNLQLSAKNSAILRQPLQCPMP